jgi:hypothetical protein
LEQPTQQPTQQETFRNPELLSKQPLVEESNEGEPEQPTPETFSETSEQPSTTMVNQTDKPIEQRQLPLTGGATQDDPYDTTDATTDFENLYHISIYKINSMITKQAIGDSMESYRGYAETGEKNTVYAIFKYAPEYPPQHSITSATQTWVTIHDIINARSYLSVPISSSVLSLFYKNNFLLHLYHPLGFALPNPHTFYMCESTENKQYTNLYYTQADERDTTVPLLYPHIQHDFFGKTYLFSSEPLQTTNIENIKRYALFIHDAIYVLNKEIPIETYLSKGEGEGDDEDKEYACENYPCVHFTEGAMEYWAVSTSTRFTEI